MAKLLQPDPGQLCNEVVQQIRTRLDARNGILGKRAGSQPPAERPKPKAMPQTAFVRPGPPPIPDLLPPPSPPPEERPPPLPYEAHNEDLREEQEKEETLSKMEEEIEKKARELQEVAALGKESSLERRHVLATLDKVLPQIVDEYDSFFDPKRRKERLDAVAEFERNLRANGEEGLIAKHSRRDAKETFLRQVGHELQQLREKEAEWIKKLIEPFESVMSDTAFDPIERLLQEYRLPEFLKKALWLSQGGSQPEYSEDGFAHANGAPNYTRILVRLGYLTLRPGFRGRKASIYDYEPELTPEEKNNGPTWNRYPVSWGTWWCRIGGFDPFEPEETDANGWTALHHACDSGFSKRAYLAAKDILDGRNFRDDDMKSKMKEALVSKTKGWQPHGFSALHFACDGQSRDCDNTRLVEALLQRRADIECKDSKGNTPLLKAAGQGLVHVCELLLASRADVMATDDNGAGAVQKADKNEALKRKLEVHGCQMTRGARWQKQRNPGGLSGSRALRQEYGAAHAATNHPIGKGGTEDVVKTQYGCWKNNERLAATGIEPSHSEDIRGSWAWCWEDRRGSRESWDEQHPHGHASKGSSSWNSWNESGKDWRSW